MIRWKLKEVMARYDITGVDLADELRVRTATISNLRRSKGMPRLNGEKIDELTAALSKLSGTKIYFHDLYEDTELVRRERANFRYPITV